MGTDNVRLGGDALSKSLFAFQIHAENQGNTLTGKSASA